MQTSKKTDYALHALMILARRKEDISVERLAEIQNIPETYLAKVMQKMSAAGIVKSSEGKGGGYSLSLPAEKIDITSIFKITEGKKIYLIVLIRQEDVKSEIDVRFIRSFRMHMERC